ncbi:uncharacterized protein LOC126987455 [Eriocheir sinensis]|uniref:uncharacterized protein LOC126987455 n=1 Tax=Eriocheir sinensis TaxID=95602 RepID=UPI0021CA18C4|nr:uncharacterized protein LOC126987455 [Eriocheir sinensis]
MRRTWLPTIPTRRLPGSVLPLRNGACGLRRLKRWPTLPNLTLAFVRRTTWPALASGSSRIILAASPPLPLLLKLPPHPWRVCSLVALKLSWSTVIEVPLEDTHPAAAPRQPTRRRLDFPAEAGLTPAQQYTWFASLLKQHGELEPLFKEGRLRSYLTVRDDVAFYKRLLTEGFLDVVLVENAAERQHTVIIHNVPLYMNANLIETPDNFLWIKRRYAGTAPRPQLLGAVVGHVPTEVHLLGVGRKAVEPYTAEPDICRHCCRWGHQEWRCRSAPRCRYCAGTHKSALCLQKIQAGTPVPRKCCNCGGEHNAHYHSCPMKPKPSRVAAPDHHPQQGRPRVVFRPAPLPQSSAWARGAPTTSEFPPLPGSSAPAAPASPTATPVPRQAPAPAPQPQPTVPPVPAASPPAVDGSTPVLHQILAAVTQLQETLAATISRVAALEQRVSTPPPVRELSSIPAPAPASAPAPCPALLSAGEAMDADSGDSVAPPAGQMQNTPATPPAVVTAAAEGTAEPRHGQTGPSPSPADPPLQWEATLQVLLAQFASLTQQVAELHHRITPLLDRQPPPPDQCLLSDHFALETTIPIQPAPAVSRKRLAVPAARMPRLVAEVGAWYHTVKGSFTDAASLYHGLLDTVESFVAAGRAPPRPAKRRLQTYASDPAVSNCQRTLASYQRRWQQDPADRAARDAMIAVARHLTELRQEARSRHWVAFLASVRKTRSLREVWHHVNRVRGRTKRLVSDPDPVGRAQDLMRQWQRASSLGGLPAQHQAELARHRERRMALVQHHVTLLDDTCVPITHDELLLAVKHGKSTAPGHDGLTYDILNALLVVQGDNPLLDLFNMSFAAGCLPPPWKAALIVPIPKGDGTFRPISLTSCVCKLLERVILNRLLYKLGDRLSPNLHGFMKGRSTSDCFLKCLSNPDVNCRAFVDLKGAFDRANKDVIMEELTLQGVRGRLLSWIRDYLYGRRAQVVFQGATSTEEVFELGTPQGGVLSPMLFNILMDKIARWPFPGNTQVIIYADDILVQCSSPALLSLALEQLSALCEPMGLVINELRRNFKPVGGEFLICPALMALL